MTGTVTLSMEIELGWGTHDKEDYGYFSPDASAESDMLAKLLDQCDSYEIPISFDVVAHLLHDSCCGEHTGPYPEGWWSEDPGTDPVQDPLFYAPDLVGMVRDAEVDHEICTHTYSHILTDQVSSEVIERELEKVSEAHKEFGIDQPHSIVFPRHQTPPLEVLDGHGIDVVRRPVEDYDSPSGIVRKFFWALRRTHPVTGIETSDGVTETLCTPHPSLSTGLLPTGQKKAHPLLRLIPTSFRQNVQERYIRSAVDNAAEADGYVHLWSHLFNISNDAQQRPLMEGLRYISERRDGGDITVKTMSELSEASV